MIASHLFKSLNIKYTNTYVRSYFDQHPFPNSLLAITDLLESYKISSETYLTSDDKISEFSLPFIAKKNSPEEFVMVTAINDSHINYVGDNGKAVMMIKHEFLLSWSGIGLVPETSELSGEPDYKANFMKQLSATFSKWLIRFTAVICPILLLVFTYNQNRSIDTLCQTVLSLVGVVICGLLIYQSMDESNPFVRKLCTYKGRSDCGEITSGKGGKLFNVFKWSEIGFIYFSAIFLLLTVSKFTVSNHSFLAILSLCSLPYMVYSVTFQWLILKKWCRLCLAVQVVLLIQFAIQYNYLADFRSVDIHSILFFGFFSIILMAMLRIYVPLKSDAIALISLSKQLGQLKKDRELFDSLLYKRQKLTFNNAAVGSISFGSEQATTVIKCVTNPSCGPCGPMFKKLDRWLSENSSLRVEFLFWGNADKNSFENNFIRHLIALYNEKGSCVSYEAYKSWYETPRKLDVWMADSPVDVDGSEVESLLEAHSQFCVVNKIPHTPAIFVDDHLLPQVYDIEDLKWFF
ncbi:Peptidase C39 family protein [Mucilaginibacter mallensis]|uniref:Peptidase C39 family protein n=1 Tax=Mucilaginibacter mallensis TaxID=652787 RepID=A0A1H1ZTV6_MUCMA|nr:vitamin K epoxide reductase family protein [Mucilaginibacter mallensis]SDT37007.1 Peptidase C39 family protein [Mucilaginibacter mallensis]